MKKSLLGATLVASCAVLPLVSQSGTFTNTAPLQHDRAFHGASALSSGTYQVIVSAGVNSDGATINRAEGYNGSSWTYIASLQHDRKYHTQTTLKDGTVLVTGGENNDGNTLNTAELWNPANNTWTYVGTMVHDRAFHTATLLVTSGKVLIAGGVNNNHNTIASAELYDPATRTFTALPNLQHDRASHTATLIPASASPTRNDIVVIAGGHNDDPDATHSAETYDAGTGTFTLTANSLRQDRTNHAAVYLPTINKVLVASGINSANPPHTITSAELYDPVSRTWAFTGYMVHDRQYLTLSVLPNGQALAAGGRNNDGTTVQYVELYNPASASWANTGYLNYDRSNHSATSLRDGSIIVAGGRDNDGDTRHQTEQYHP